MEEKMGWERPGFYVKNEMVKIQNYDWQGYYGKKKHLKHRHEELVLGDCKYTLSDHHHLVRICLGKIVRGELTFLFFSSSDW